MFRLLEVEVEVAMGGHTYASVAFEYDRDTYLDSLALMVPDALWAMEEASRIRKKAYKFSLQDKKIWYHIGSKDIF